MIAIAAKSVTLAALVGAAFAVPAHVQRDGEINRYEGRCDYGPQIENAPPQVTFANCRSLSIERNGNAGSIIYLNSLDGLTIRYDGVLKGNEMTVQSLTTRGRESREATGDCRILYIDDRLSSVTCVGQIGINILAASFIRQRINF